MVRFTKLPSTASRHLPLPLLLLLLLFWGRFLPSLCLACRTPDIHFLYGRSSILHAVLVSVFPLSSSAFWPSLSLSLSLLSLPSLLSLFSLSCMQEGQQKVGDALRCSNEEFLVNMCHQPVLTTSPPFVHTARNSYRLSDPVIFFGCNVLRRNAGTQKQRKELPVCCTETHTKRTPRTIQKHLHHKKRSSCPNTFRKARRTKRELRKKRLSRENFPSPLWGTQNNGFSEVNAPSPNPRITNQSSVRKTLRSIELRTKRGSLQNKTGKKLTALPPNTNKKTVHGLGWGRASSPLCSRESSGVFAETIFHSRNTSSTR